MASAAVARITVSDDLPREIRDGLPMAENGCAYCYGLGALSMYKPTARLCKCVHRNTFTACLAHYHAIEDKAGSWDLANPRIEVSSGNGGSGFAYAIPMLEYRADFEGTCRKALAGRCTELAVFEAYHLAGDDYKSATVSSARKTGIALNRGMFFHAVYRIEEICGAALRSTRPHALFPLDSYYSARVVRPSQIARGRMYRAVAA